MSTNDNVMYVITQDGSVGQDEDERNELLEGMASTQPWASPPPNPPLAPDADPCAAGEESTERAAEAHRIQMVEPFPPLHSHLALHQMPQDPFDLAYPEPDQPLDHALALIILLTPKEIADQQAVQQQHQQHMGHPPGFHSDPNAHPVPHQLPHGQMLQQGLAGYAGAPLQPAGAMQQQPGGPSQYPPPQQPRPLAALGPFSPLHQGSLPPHMGHVGDPPFRGLSGPPQAPPGPPQQQGPPIMRPLQVLLATLAAAVAPHLHLFLQLPCMANRVSDVLQRKSYRHVGCTSISRMHWHVMACFKAMLCLLVTLPNEIIIHIMMHCQAFDIDILAVQQLVSHISMCNLSCLQQQPRHV